MTAKCKKCKRTLKNLNSIQIGYGPVCARKEGVIKVKRRTKKIKRKSYSVFEFNNEV